MDAQAGLRLCCLQTPEDRFSCNWSLNKDKESILFFCCKMDSSGTVEILNSAVLCRTALFDRMLGINGLMNLLLH